MYTITLDPTVTLPTHAAQPRPDGLAVRTEQYVRAAQRGDVAAFEQLYRLMADRVYALCMRMTGDPQRAQELAHDAFVRAWDALPTYNSQAAFATWMHRLTVNVVLQDSRSAKRRDARVRLADNHETLDAPASTPDVSMRVDLESALARLAPEARQIVVLHDIEGYRHEEIASLLGVAPGTVRARLHHARKQLKEWIHHD